MKNVLILMIINLLGKVFSFGRELIFSYYYGTGIIKDAFNISTVIASTIFSLIAISLSRTFIPVYTEVYKRDQQEGLNVFVSNLLNILMFISTLVMIAGLLFAPILVKIFAVGFRARQFTLAVNFTRIMMLTIYANVYNAVFTSYFQIKNNFVIPALPLIILNTLLAIFIIISGKTNILVLSVGIFVAYNLQFVMYPFYVRKYGFRHKKIFNIHDRIVKKVFKLAVPTLFSQASVTITTIVDQSFASFIMPTGGVSIMDYALKITRLVDSVLLIPINTTLYPKLGELAGDKDKTGLRDLVLKMSVVVCFLIIPAIVMLMALSEPVIQIIYERGKFDHQSTILTAGALFFYAPLLLGPSLNQIANLSFYSILDTKTPGMIVFFQVILNAVGNLLFSKFLGLKGLALSTSVTVTMGMIISFILLEKKIGRLDKTTFFRNLVKISLSAAFMAISTLFVFNLVKSALILKFISSGLIGLTVYLSAVYLMKIDYIDEFVQSFIKKIKRTK